MANPNMKRGGPSVNPLGRGARKALGSDGVIAPGGFLYHGERDAKLRGDSRWVTYDNLIANTSIVAAAVRLWLDLAGSVKWSVEPGEGPRAQDAAELFEECLICNHSLSKPWRNVVKRQVMKKFRGFSMHEMIFGRRADGVVTFVDLQHRPQWTIYRWEKPSEVEPWNGIEQRTRSGATYQIPRDRLFYSVEDALTDSPDGVGILRHVVESSRVLERYLQLEGIGFDTDMAGVPIGRAPLAELGQLAVKAGVDPANATAISAWVSTQVEPLRELIQKRVVTANRSILLDSVTYPALDVDGSESPSGTYKWDVDTIKTSIASMPDLARAIARETTAIARVMYADWLLLGSGDATGAYAMTEIKVEQFCAAVNAAIDDVAGDADRDLARRWAALNGFDVDTETPRLVHEPIARQSVEATARALVLISQAALRPDDPAADILRARLDLPSVPEIDLSGDAMLPRVPAEDAAEPIPVEPDEIDP